MNFLKKQIKYTVTFKKQLIIALILGAFLSFVLIFLEPFNTDDFESRFKTEILLGFGLIFFVFYTIYSRIENKFYIRFGRIWLVKNEIISLFLFLMVSGTIFFFYNSWINEMTYSLSYHLYYYKYIVFAFIPIILPLLYFLRNRFGELKTPSDLNRITINGMNKHEILGLNKQDLLFVKASENYSQIYFVFEDKIKHVTFRNTLSDINVQAPFLKKCHRSYIVNTEKVDKIEGNSQSAKLIFKQYNIDIPLSKTYYKSIVLLVKSLSVYP